MILWFQESGIIKKGWLILSLEIKTYSTMTTVPRCAKISKMRFMSYLSKKIIMLEVIWTKTKIRIKEFTTSAIWQRGTFPIFHEMKHFKWRKIMKQIICEIVCTSESIWEWYFIRKLSYWSHAFFFDFKAASSFEHCEKGEISVEYTEKILSCFSYFAAQNLKKISSVCLIKFIVLKCILNLLFFVRSLRV